MSHTDDSTLFATLVEVQENRLVGRVQGADSEFPRIRLEGREVASGQVGAYVLVEQGPIRIIGMIKRVWQEEAVGGRRGLLEMIPLGELDDQGDFQRGVVRYPVPGAGIHVVRRTEVDALFSKYRDRGLELGFLPSLPSIDVCLDPSTLFGRHLAVLGQSGSGKSWSVASLLQRALEIMPDAHVILLDLHGEYVWRDDQGRRQAAFPEAHYRYLDARELEIPYWLLTYGELVDLLIDRTDDKASTQMAFLREVLLALRRKANPEMKQEQITVDSPVYFSLAELFHQFKRANEQVTDFGKVKGPLYGQFDEFLIKLQARFNDVRYDFLFKPRRRRSSDTLADLLRDFVGLRDPARPINVIDFSPVPFDVRPTVTAQIGRLAFEFNYWNPRSREFPVLLVCEEAHAYIPRGSGGRYQDTRRSMERIAKEGRKYGIGLVVVSQRPHELSETVLAQCGNFICLRVTNPDDQQYIRELVPDSEGGLVNILSTLGRGEALALGEAVPIPTRFQFYPPDPAPNSGDIDFYHHWRGGAEELDVEAIVAAWRRQRRD